MTDRAQRTQAEPATKTPTKQETTMAGKTATKEDVSVETVATNGDPKTFHGGAITTATQNRDLSTDVNDDDFFSGSTGLDNIDARDVALPRWTILQGLSPQVNSRKDEYVEGAKIGMLFNTSTGEVAERKNFVFAHYERRYVEWVPRELKSACPFQNLPKPVGGGLYKDYGIDDSELAHARRWEENGSLWTPRGNELVETGTWYTIDPDTLSLAFIAMAKTQFTSSKKLMAAVRDQRILHKGQLRPAPLFGFIWEMTTTMRQNGENEWFVWAGKAKLPIIPDPRIKRVEIDENGNDITTFWSGHPNYHGIMEAVRNIQTTVQRQEFQVDMAAGEVPVGAEAGARVQGDDAAM